MMNDYKLKPFVKWAGGKSQLLPKLIELAPKKYNNYYEPFIGGGAFLFEIKPQNAYINDVNSQLLNVYRELKYNAESVIKNLKSLDSIECDKEHYIKVRAHYNNKIVNGELDVECAALMIWINKHCFNGLYRVNSKGLFNVPYNNKKSGTSMDENNLRMIGKYLLENDVVITEGDFTYACSSSNCGDFVYFDSPYIPVSETANFTDYTKDGFTYEDHIRLSNLFKELDKRGVLLMLSNNNVPLVHEIYKDYNIYEIDVRRSINRDASKRSGKEVIVTNY